MVIDQLAAKGKTALLVLAGHPLFTYEETQRLATDLRLESNLRFLDHVEDVSGLLRAVDLGILSTHYEGMSNVILEYMAAGLPVVATDIPGVGDILGPSNKDFWVNPYDVNSLAQCILRFALDKELRVQTGIANRQRVQTEYTVDRMLERTTEFLVSKLALVISNRKNRSATTMSHHSTLL